MKGNNMSKENDKYVMFKNFLHNELGIAKEDIRLWIDEAVKNEITKLVENTYNEYNIRHYIREELTSRYGNNLKHEIKSQLAEVIVENIDVSFKTKNYTQLNG